MARRIRYLLVNFVHFFFLIGVQRPPDEAQKRGEEFVEIIEVVVVRLGWRGAVRGKVEGEE